jgi:hypothetical protein
MKFLACIFFFRYCFEQTSVSPTTISQQIIYFTVFPWLITQLRVEWWMKMVQFCIEDDYGGTKDEITL